VSSPPPSGGGGHRTDKPIAVNCLQPWFLGRQLTKNLGRKSLKKAVKYYYSQTKTIYYKALFTDAAADVNDAIYDAIYN